MIMNDAAKGPGVSAYVPEVIVNADGSRAESETLIVKEHAIRLIINEQNVTKLVCTPSDLLELVIGYMKAEGYIQTMDDIEDLHICEQGNKANVTLSCQANRTQLKRLAPAEWKTEWIFGLANAFAGESKIHKSTKGTHCCYLSIGGEILYFAEDIGRHNAMDKAIGYAVINHLDLSSCILFSTGRVPTEIVKKAVGAGIPVLVSKAVPTDQAIEMAREYNLTLICKAWPDRFEIFHHGSN